MKILHILFSKHYSGAENVVCQIVSMFKLYPDVQMIYCSPDGPIRQALEERDVPYYMMNGFSPSEIRKAILRVKPDVIHVHDMKAAVVTALVSGKIPLISHIHNNNFDSRKINIKSILFWLVSSKFSRVFWVSKSSFEGYRFHKNLRKKSTVLYNIIDANELRKKAKSDTKDYNYDIAYVGRLTPQKNPQRLMGVIRGIVSKNPKVKVAVVGTGDLEDETRSLAEEYGLGDNVDFLGFQSNPYKLLQDAKLMLMTSRWEGTPMCALEAMALGVPIVSTPTDGLCELVDNGVTGYLCDEDDGLVEGCLEIINDNGKRNEMSAATRNKAAIMMDTDAYRASVAEAYRQALE